MSSDIDGYKVFQDDKKFKKAVEKLPAHIQKVLKAKIEFLSENPYHNSLNTKSYTCSGKKKKDLDSQGIKDIREFYINGKKYRCVFYVIPEQKMLFLAYVGLHDQLERWSKQ
jgi:mRNA-degrading endonuclease HigB of HigAB toxin-antitoxin module